MLLLTVVVILWLRSFSVILINFHFKHDKADVACGPQRCLEKKLFFKKSRASNCKWWCVSAPVPGGLKAAAPEEMRIPCVTLMASVPWNLFLYGIEVKSDIHLFQLDVGSVCANARSCWIEVKLSGLTFADFTKLNPEKNILNSKWHCSWFDKSWCLSCSVVVFTSTSMVDHQCCLRIRSGSSGDGAPCMDGVPGSQQHPRVLVRSCLREGPQPAVLKSQVSAPALA